MKYHRLTIESGNPILDIPDGAIVVAAQPCKKQGMLGLQGWEEGDDVVDAPYDGNFMDAQFWQYVILVPVR